MVTNHCPFCGVAGLSVIQEGDWLNAGSSGNTGSKALGMKAQVGGEGIEEERKEAYFQGGVEPRGMDFLGEVPL